MKLTVLSENTTNTRGLQGEAGLSIYVEDGATKVLFDLGASDLFIRNAAQLGIDLSAITHIILSHGHYDHTWGLRPFIEAHCSTLTNYEYRPRLIAHPLAFSKRDKAGLNMGLNVPTELIEKAFHVTTSCHPIRLSKQLLFMGEINRRHSFEGNETLGEIYIEGKPTPDFMHDDSALVYQSDNGIVIITGCSHAGICNVIEQAKKICHDERVTAVIGGLHLRNPSNFQLTNTLIYLRDNHVQSLYAGHCTDQPSRIALAQLGILKTMQVGLSLEFS